MQLCLLWSMVIFSKLLVPCKQSFCSFGYVKAPGLNDRKASCIELIQRASFNRGSFHVSPNCKNCVHRAGALVPEINPPQIAAPTAFRYCAEQNKPVILLYYASYCPYSQKVLGYLHLIHKTVPMKDVTGNAKEKEELFRIGGKLQVPCLIVDGKAIYESDVIIEWLSQNKDLLDTAP